MKKLLLVLLVVAIASFLFVGCLPVTPSEGEGEGEGEGEVTITIDGEYTNTGGVTFVACKRDVTITFPEPVETDNIVYIAKKIVDGEGNVEYRSFDAEPIPAIPNADRTVWTVEGYEFLYGWPCGGILKAESKNGIACECEPVCLVALVKHPCCPGEEVALRVVTVDCYPPTLDLFFKFTDCDDPCDDPDPCVPEFAGVSMEWSSRTTDICETTDCCSDDCSGINSWELVVDPDPCEGPCDTVTGVSCPVEGALGCECLAYADTGEVCYYVDFYMDDNVGNDVESRWKICLDTDEVISVEVDYGPEDTFSSDYSVSPDSDGWYQIYFDCTPT